MDLACLSAIPSADQLRGMKSAGERIYGFARAPFWTLYVRLRTGRHKSWMSCTSSAYTEGHGSSSFEGLTHPSVSVHVKPPLFLSQVRYLMNDVRRAPDRASRLVQHHLPSAINEKVFALASARTCGTLAFLHKRKTGWRVPVAS